MLKKLLKQGPTRPLKDRTGSIRGRRLVALRRAAISATNPEFKTLWSEKLYELAEFYDYQAGIKYAEGYKYHPND